MTETSGTSVLATSWSLVLGAAQSPTAESRRALTTLRHIYWNPVYSFIRRSGHDADESQDLTQEFFVTLIEKNYLRSADRNRGRFRSFLLTSVKHFLCNEWDRAHAKKRGGGQVPVSLDLATAEERYLPAAVESSTPESLFERRWALSLLEHAMARLRAEWTAMGRAGQFDNVAAFLYRNPGDGVRYEELAVEMGISAGTLRMSVHRLRRRYRELLRSEIGETVASQEEVDEEMVFLLSVLSSK